MNKKFNDDGYLVIRNFISKDLCKFAQLYYKIRQDTLQYDIDNQCPESKSFYADPFCETLLLSSCRALSKETEIELLPTYSYTRVYGKGDELHIHRDRPECQYSATLNLGRPLNEDNSAIYMSKNSDGSDASTVLLEEGDLCIYKGNIIYHWREPFKQSWYLQTFLHYVDSNGEYKDRLFDGRRTLGIKK